MIAIKPTRQYKRAKMEKMEKIKPQLYLSRLRDPRSFDSGAIIQSIRVGDENVIFLGMCEMLDDGKLLNCIIYEKFINDYDKNDYYNDFGLSFVKLKNSISRMPKNKKESLIARVIEEYMEMTITFSILENGITKKETSKEEMLSIVLKNIEKTEYFKT